MSGRRATRFAAAPTSYEEGTFRRDLFFRINVVSLEVPSLNRRKEDIPLLLDFALDKFNQKYGKRIRGFSPEAMQVLLEHDYPGNVRELLNLVEQVVILCHSGEIESEHLPASLNLTHQNIDTTEFGVHPVAQRCNCFCGTQINAIGFAHADGVDGALGAGQRHSRSPANT